MGIYIEDLLPVSGPSFASFAQLQQVEFDDAIDMLGCGRLAVICNAHQARPDGGGRAGRSIVLASLSPWCPWNCTLVWTTHSIALETIPSLCFCKN